MLRETPLPASVANNASTAVAWAAAAARSAEAGRWAATLHGPPDADLARLLPPVEIAALRDGAAVSHAVLQAAGWSVPPGWLLRVLAASKFNSFGEPLAPRRPLTLLTLPRGAGPPPPFSIPVAGGGVLCYSPRGGMRVGPDAGGKGGGGGKGAGGGGGAAAAVVPVREVGWDAERCALVLHPPRCLAPLPPEMAPDIVAALRAAGGALRCRGLPARQLPVRWDVGVGRQPDVMGQVVYGIIGAAFNHSTNPNLAVNIADGRLRMQVRRDVAPGEELEFCYGDGDIASAYGF